MLPFWLIALIGVFAAGAGRGAEVPPQTVEHVDLQRYVGLWFEIGKIPNRFQKQRARGTTAEYTLLEDGSFRVVNRCIREDGSADQAVGRAKVADPTSNAKLKVSFVRLLGMQLFWGDYWILGIGDDYEYAIVGSPDRKYGWILSRTPRVEPPVLEQVFARARPGAGDAASAARPSTIARIVHLL